MGSDDIENRMSSLGVNEMIFKTYKPVDAIIAEIEKVSEKSIREYIKNYIDLSKASVVLMGPQLKQHSEWLSKFNFAKN